MTAIFGHCLPGRVFLAADTRRRDQVTHALTTVSKLHRVSSGVLIAQGGAGSGAADEVVKRLLQIGAAATLENVSTAAAEIGPPIILEAQKTWAVSKLQMPPTRIVIAAINEEGHGEIRSVNLQDGSVGRHLETYCAGSDTPAICAACSRQHAHRAFDMFAIAVISDLERTHSRDIGFPVDVGVIRGSKLQSKQRLNRLTTNSWADRDFVFS